jgi:hypothetical protein
MRLFILLVITYFTMHFCNSLGILETSEFRLISLNIAIIIKVRMVEIVELRLTAILLIEMGTLVVMLVIPKIGTRGTPGTIRTTQYTTQVTTQTTQDTQRTIVAVILIVVVILGIQPIQPIRPTRPMRPTPHPMVIIQYPMQFRPTNYQRYQSHSRGATSNLASTATRGSILGHKILRDILFSLTQHQQLLEEVF